MNINRDNEIKKMHFDQAYTLQYIADVYKITRERVRQIIGGSNGTRSKIAKAITATDSPHLSKLKIVENIKLQYPGLSNNTLKNIVSKSHHTIKKGKYPAYVGERAELKVYGKLKSMGFSPVLMRYNHPFDILLGEIKIDVKIANTPNKTSKDTHLKYYRFAIRKNIKKDCDFFIFVVKNDFYIVPSFVFKDVQSVYIRYGKSLKPWKKSNTDVIEEYKNRFDLLK